MSLLTLILNGAWAARSRRANLELATKAFRNQLPLAVTALALVLFIMAAHLPKVALAAATGTWSKTGSLATTRWAHTATLLPNGKVLVAGGIEQLLRVRHDGFPQNSYMASAELYDPATGTWSKTGSMATPRYGHTATLLPNGKVLVAGGKRDTYMASAELYDPATGTWSKTGFMAIPRSGNTATLLPNGKVLMIGSNVAELYDPATGTWSATGYTGHDQVGYMATLLQSSKVIVMGYDLTELYDPATATWSATGSMVHRRVDYTATLLRNGKVLVVGDFSPELYDPATGTWSETGPMLGDLLEGSNRYLHTATLLADGKVLVAGGQPTSIDIMMASAQLYAPELPSQTDQQDKSK